MFSECVVQSPVMLARLMGAVPPGAPGEPPGSGSLNGFNFELLIPIVAIVLGCTVAIVAILAGVLQSAHRERTRREIAAYAAEGSISPADAERMIRAASMKTPCS